MSEVLVGELAQIADGDHRIFMIGSLEVGVFRQGAEVLAWENRCPHAGGPVCQGRIFQKVEEVLGPDRTSQGLRFTKTPHIVCPWHGYEYDLATGECAADRRLRLRRYEVVEKGDEIYVVA
jgi:nitrite reductase/ring-hydroxylating ferredoxin subunit